MSVWGVRLIGAGNRNRFSLMPISNKQIQGDGDTIPEQALDPVGQGGSAADGISPGGRLPSCPLLLGSGASSQRMARMIRGREGMVDSSCRE